MPLLTFEPKYPPPGFGPSSALALPGAPHALSSSAKQRVTSASFSSSPPAAGARPRAVFQRRKWTEPRNERVGGRTEPLPQVHLPARGARLRRDRRLNAVNFSA